MTYTGDVQTPGPTAVRLLDELVIRKVAVGPMANNAYLLTCRTGGEQLLIDAAAEPDRLLALIREGDPAGRLDHVLTTHRHPDHTGALESVLAVTGARHACGDDDAEAMPATVHRRLAHGDVLTVGHITLEVIALRGHTPGSVALAYREPTRPEPDSTGSAERAHRADWADRVPGRVHLFTGDSLFPGGPGKTTGPADFTSLMDDLTERVFTRFDDATWVYPGHGADTTLGRERPHLSAWRARGWCRGALLVTGDARPGSGAALVTYRSAARPGVAERPPVTSSISATVRRIASSILRIVTTSPDATA